MTGWGPLCLRVLRQFKAKTLVDKQSNQLALVGQGIMYSRQAPAEKHPWHKINVVNLNSISIATLYFLGNTVYILQSYKCDKLLCCEHKKSVPSDTFSPFKHQSALKSVIPQSPENYIHLLHPYAIQV